MSKGSSEVKRSARDGAIEAYRETNGEIFISVETEHEGSMVREVITMTEYNARRIVGAMCLMLGLELKPSSAKKIEM